MPENRGPVLPEIAHRMDDNSIPFDDVKDTEPRAFQHQSPKRSRIGWRHLRHDSHEAQPGVDHRQEGISGTFRSILQSGEFPEKIRFGTSRPDRLKRHDSPGFGLLLRSKETQKTNSPGSLSTGRAGT